eukprot:CAMPEP_0174271298 /NCGR_PEP_ID=MMETSP0439-20130205/47433_1 /TAXON_ID=0 /ORGANISM="Stereomyxa ramosa, Strain Chinc5" /LENGTH=573 /DNA_ID=CAMNT_0015361221 /DNA_START=225 /DNA_END=1942 /DNA_ORIENTATION=-
MCSFGMIQEHTCHPEDVIHKIKVEEERWNPPLNNTTQWTMVGSDGTLMVDMSATSSNIPKEQRATARYICKVLIDSGLKVAKQKIISSHLTLAPPQILLAASIIDNTTPLPTPGSACAVPANIIMDLKNAVWELVVVVCAKGAPSLHTTFIQDRYPLTRKHTHKQAAKVNFLFSVMAKNPSNATILRNEFQKWKKKPKHQRLLHTLQLTPREVYEFNFSFLSQNAVITDLDWIFAYQPKVVLLLDLVCSSVTATRASIKILHAKYNSFVGVVAADTNKQRLEQPSDPNGDAPDAFSSDVGKCVTLLLSKILSTIPLSSLAKDHEALEGKIVGVREQILSLQKQEESYKQDLCLITELIAEKSKLLHQDVKVKVNEIGLQLPKYWEKMEDALIQLDENSEEYTTLVNYTFKQQNRGQAGPKKIISVHRIQAVSQWQRYCAAREVIARKNWCLKDKVEEKWLFHGTDYQTASMIIQPSQGFDMRMCGKNGTRCGNGIYFAVWSDYSVGFAKPDRENSRYMFVSRVLVGKSCPTSSGDNRPHSIDPSRPGVLCDSGCDSLSSPTMFVIFDNSQVYP